MGMAILAAAKPLLPPLPPEESSRHRAARMVPETISFYRPLVVIGCSLEKQRRKRGGARWNKGEEERTGSLFFGEKNLRSESSLFSSSLLIV
jgi:hypothetical protein